MNKFFTKIAGLTLGLAMAIGVGVAIGGRDVAKADAAEGDTHDFSQSLSQLLNNNASIASITIPQQSYSIKSVVVSWRYNKNLSNAVTIEATVGGVSWGTYNVNENTGSSYKTCSFSGVSVVGSVILSFTNNTGSGTGHGTFYVNNVQLVEGAGSHTHSWSEWTITTPATCENAGEKSRTCSVCSAVETEEIPALGHDWDSGTVHAATCTTGGYTEFHCSRCEEIKYENETPALGHNYVDRICTRCGAEEPLTFDATFGTTTGGDSSSSTAISANDDTALKNNYHYVINNNLTFSNMSRLYPSDGLTIKFGSGSGGGSFTVTVPSSLSGDDIEIESVCLTTKKYGSDNVTITITANEEEQGNFSTENDSDFAEHCINFATSEQNSFTVSSTKRYYLQKISVAYKSLSSTYSVTYNGNGNTSGDVPTDASSPYNSGETVTVLGNTGNLAKTDFTFNGWNTQADGKGTHYAATGSATFTISTNTTLYAEWAKSLDAITAIGGTVSGSVSDHDTKNWNISNLTVTGTLSGSTGQDVLEYVDITINTNIPSSVQSISVSITVSKKENIPGSATSLTSTVTGEVEAAKLTYSVVFDYTKMSSGQYAVENANNPKTSKATCTNHDDIDVQWESYQVMRTNGTALWMQFQGSGGGCIYNITELPGAITNVTLTEANGNTAEFYTYYGNTQHPTSGTTVGGKYFCVGITSGTGYLESITVTFQVSDKPKVQLAASNMNLDVASGATAPTITDGSSAVTGYNLVSGDDYIALITNDKRVQPIGYGKVIISVSKDEDAGHIYLPTTFTVMVGDSSKEASIMAFSAKASEGVANRTADDGVVWAITAGQDENDFSEDYGINYGTANKTITSLVITTPADENRIIKNVVVEAMSASGNTTITVSVGGTAFTCSKTNTVTPNITTFNFSGNKSGAITITISGSASSKYGVKSIAVLYVGDEATSFASTFLGAISCKADGTSKPSFNIKQGETRWTWLLLKAEFDALDPTDQAKFAVGATGVSSAVSECVARYDYIVGKYYKTGLDTSFTDFMNRNPSPIGGSGRIVMATVGKNTSSVIAIVVISAISAAAIGGYFLFRKKKED